MRETADELSRNRRFGTAHVYRSTLRTLEAFCHSQPLPFGNITPEWLKRFEASIRQRGCSWNTVSTYLRTLRAVYNRAVDRRLAVEAPRLFRNVYTGTRADCRRALDDADLRRLFASADKAAQSRPRPLPLRLRRTRDLFVLMFLLRGIPFVDLAYLRKSDLRGNLIVYRRRKTGRTLHVSLPAEAMELLCRCTTEDRRSPYLFPLLRSSGESLRVYNEYRSALRAFNRRLAALAKRLGMSGGLSTYSARHTWATTAYHCEVHPGIISEAMGHSSIAVTETYLKPFRHRKIDDANRKLKSHWKDIAGGLRS